MENDRDKIIKINKQNHMNGCIYKQKWDECVVLSLRYFISIISSQSNIILILKNDEVKL